MSTTIEILPDFVNWKIDESYELNSCLGSDICTVEFLEFEGIPVLKPGEDSRIRRAQIKLFCDWIISNKEKIEPEQLRYVMSILELRQSTLAKALAVTEGSVSQFLSGESKWKESTHRQLVLLFLNELRQPGSIKSLSENKPPLDSILDRLPLSKMIKRNWIVSNKLSDMQGSLLNFFAGDFGKLERTVDARFRISDPSKIDKILVGCWMQHLRNLAANKKIAQFDKENLKKSIPQLLELTLNESGLAQIEPLLNRCGIHFFAIKALEGSKFDGAVFLEGSNPIIGIAMRHDRIDWFWFTLFHEIAHIIFHDISEGRVDINPLKSELDDELEANRWAGEMLVPKKAIEGFRLTKNMGQAEKIKLIASEYRRHPGIIAGRLQHEGKIPWKSKICSELKVPVARYFASF